MKNYFLRTISPMGQEGPFNLEQLKSRNLSKTTPIWYEGLGDWTPAGQIDELNDLFKAMPPPFSDKKPVDKPVGKSLLWKLITCIAAVILVMAGIQLYNQIKQNQRIESQQLINSLDNNQKETVKKNIASYIRAGNSSYIYSGLGGIKNLSLTVTNNSPYMLNHVRVKLSYIKADGGLWRDQMVDFTYIPANSIQTVKVPDTDRGTSIRYEIIEIKSEELGLN